MRVRVDVCVCACVRACACVCVCGSVGEASHLEQLRLACNAMLRISFFSRTEQLPNRPAQ